MDCTIGALDFGNGVLPDLAIDEVAYNIDLAPREIHGGQGVVYLCRWQHPPHKDWESPFEEGRALAIKHCMKRCGGGKHMRCSNPDQFQRAVALGHEALAAELRALSTLHKYGCGSRVVRPLATVQWPGDWTDDEEDRRRTWCIPTYAYVMPQYRLGSVASLLDDICYRRASEAVQRQFLSMKFLSGEMSTLLGELHKIHTTEGVELMIQDLTPSNLLVDDEYTGGSGLRLLLADPGMAKPISRLTSGARTTMGTWLWGSMAVRRGLFDETADVYSLSFIGAEMWLVAEGAAMPTRDVVILLGLEKDRPQGVQFMRHLVLEMVKVHHQDGKLQPRVQRHLPVSWLGAWALLLGCRDHRTLQCMVQHQLPCLRPSEADMLQVYQQWARIAATAEELPADLSAEQAQAPGCAGLVQDMCGLFERLKQLSHLGTTDEGLEDAPTRWFAANFTEQQHPLVAAMRAQGAVGAGKPDAARAVGYPDWLDVVQAAQKAVHNRAHAMDLEWQRDAGASLWLRQPNRGQKQSSPPKRKRDASIPTAHPTNAQQGCGIPRQSPDLRQNDSGSQASQQAAHYLAAAPVRNAHSAGSPCAAVPASPCGLSSQEWGSMSPADEGSPTKRARVQPAASLHPPASSRGRLFAAMCGEGSRGMAATPAPASLAPGVIAAVMCGAAPECATSPAAGGRSQAAAAAGSNTASRQLSRQAQAQPQLQSIPPSEFGKQFSAFAYPAPATRMDKWGKAEQAYAQQIAAAFKQRFPGLADSALYLRCHMLQVPGFTRQQLDEAMAAKKQLCLTFERCFAARYAADKGRKMFRDNIRQLLGHRQ